MKRAPKAKPRAKVISFERMRALRDTTNKPMSRADRDAICLAVETMFTRLTKLEEAHNRDTKELREVHIRVNLLENTVKRLRERVEGSDSE